MSWQKFAAITCSHGHLADYETCRAFVRFCKHFQPDVRIHLGDAIDLAALRKGVKKGEGNTGAEIQADVQQGLDFIEEMKADVWMLGNHEFRIYRTSLEDQDHVYRAYAQTVIEAIDTQAKKLKCRLFPYHHNRGVYRLARGKLAFCHGYTCNMQSVRQHAEHFAFGPGSAVLMGHLHTVEHVPGRYCGGTEGYSIGYAGNENKMHYAQQRLATSRWQQAWAYGVVKEQQFLVWLAKKCGDRWILPTGLETF